jgi:ATP-dependent protease ClpP protease subunit
MSKHELFQFQFDAQMQAEDVGEIMIYSAIVSWKWRPEDPEVTAKDFDAALKKIKDAKRINLRINSPGGSVYQAVAIRAMMVMVDMKEKHIYIEGLCASAATLLLTVPGWTVHIFEGSNVMVHNPRSYAIGEAQALEKEAKVLRKMEGEFRGLYAKRTNKDEATIKAWMDETHWFTAQEAVDEGFADEVLEAADAVACASIPEDAVALMRDMYGDVPNNIHIVEGKPPVSDGTPAVAAGAPTEHKDNDDKGEKTVMAEIKDITQEQLRAENTGVFDSIMKAGAEAERMRMQEIDDMTPPGYEALAATAKTNGTSAVDFHKQVVKAQREKGPAFVAQRQKETEPAAKVTGEASDEPADGDEKKMAASVQEIAAFAKAARGETGGGMY